MCIYYGVCHDVSRYKLTLLKPCQKAVNQSTKISIRMDRRGFLSLQFMILTNDKQICFVEYLVRGVSQWREVLVFSLPQCVPDEEDEEKG